MNVSGWFVRVWRFYVDGFRSMTVGRALWVLIIVKFAVIFLVLKLCFFPDVLADRADTADGKAELVRSSLTERQSGDNSNNDLRYGLD